MRRASLLLALGAGACAGTEAPARLYHFDAVPLPVAGARLPCSLAVGPVVVAPHLERDALVARVSPIELETYAGHRWAVPLDRLLADAIVRALASSGAFERVVRQGEEPTLADASLSLVVRAFEEEDREDGWWGVVRLGAVLRDLRTGGVLWNGELRGERRAATRHPSRVVEALREALGDALASAEWRAPLVPPPAASSPAQPGQ